MTTETTTTRSSLRSARKNSYYFILVALGLTLFLLSPSNEYTSIKLYITGEAKNVSSTALLIVDSPDEQTIKSMDALFVENTTIPTRSEERPDIAAVEGQVAVSSSIRSTPSSLQSATTTIPTDLYAYLPWPKLVFHCGWHADLLSSLVFPNVTSQEYQGFLSLQQQQQQQSRNATNTTQTHEEEEEEASAFPPLVVGMHGLCDLNENATTAVNRKEMWVHVQRYFPGRAVFFNGESFGDARGHNTYQVGTIAKSSHNNDTRSLTDFYYMSLAFLEVATTMPPEQRDVLFDHAQKPKNAGKHGVIYVASHCVNFREDAADRISDIHPEHLMVHYGGRCRGQRAEAADAAAKAANTADAVNMTQQLKTSKLLPSPIKRTGRQRYTENFNLFQQYRYCLVLENLDKSGYITEKIVFAFLGGCVPIYYGTTEVFDIFNKDAFIYYDIHNPEHALEQIRYMEIENRTAYDEMLSQPILANGRATVERYFSLQDDIGGGKLIRRIRAMLGYDPNNPAGAATSETSS
jgi:Glycosyltransferase family 10 (fucosyltransferase) C-term